MDHEHFLGVLEGLLFAVGDEGVSLEQLVEVLEIEKDDIELLIGELRMRYDSRNQGLAISQMAGVYKMVTKKDHAPYFKKLFENPGQKTLTSAALEVLAIIAYKQPITRGEIEAVRGVSNDAIMKKLLLFDLIEEAGRSRSPGRPMKFRTTNSFLDYFGIKTIEELPVINEAEILDSSDKEMSLFR